jgi:hypothetical protein
MPGNVSERLGSRGLSGTRLSALLSVLDARADGQGSKE